MDDKNIMENILLLQKGACDLFLHGAIESSTDKVNKTFDSALTNALTMQDTTYGKMAAKGWYPSEQADQSKLTTVKQKFSPQSGS